MKRVSAVVLVALVAAAATAQADTTPPPILSPCSGTALGDVPRDVTKQMSAVAPGVTVRQLTGLDVHGVSTGRWSYVTNSDVPIYSLIVGRLIYNVQPGIFGAISDPDGEDQQKAGTKAGLHVRPALNGDGFVQPVGTKSGSTVVTDLWYTNVTKGTACKSVQITFINLPNLSTNNGIPTGLPVFDPAVGKNLIVWAPDGFLHRVYEDGSLINGGAGVLPADGFPASQGFHRLRSNYKLPQWVHYTRTGDTVARLWLYNLQTGQACYIPGGNHDANSHDGTMYAVQDPKSASFWLYKIFDANGNPLEDCSGAKAIAVTGLNLSRQTTPNTPSDFCAFSADDSFLVCVAGRAPLPGHASSEHALFTMSLDGKSVTFLTATDGAQTGVYEGIPVAVYGHTDSNGQHHLYFRSDKGGTPQLYEVIY